MTTIGKLEGVVGRLSLVFHLIEQPHSSEVNADIVTRVVDVVKIVESLLLIVQTAVVLVSLTRVTQL
jgi:hypothetical protein